MRFQQLKKMAGTGHPCVERSTRTVFVNWVPATSKRVLGAGNLNMRGTGNLRMCLEQDTLASPPPPHKNRDCQLECPGKLRMCLNPES